ncbi:MAG: hypothetical protein IT302_09295 [Dehalococcoidia bacterium]|nr:hypothetical protein [Dehalococcoidia bacterium]
MALGHDPTELVADADVLMNLMASGCAEEILSTLLLTLVVPPAVADEAIYIEVAERGSERQAIDLSPLGAAGLVAVTAVDATELDLVVDLAALVDDGEAEAIAIAEVRQLAVATDDRKARRIASERSVARSSTPELLHAWQRVGQIALPRLSAVLRSIETRSRYRPPRDHPLFNWWSECADSTPEEQP